MAAIALRQTTYDALSARNKVIARHALAFLALGEPAQYTDGTNTWLVWDDNRITLLQVAVIGCLAANLASIPAGYTIPASREQLEADIVSFLGSKLKRPENIAYTAEGDRWAETLAANNAPAAIRAFTAPPTTWTPVGA